MPKSNISSGDNSSDKKQNKKRKSDVSDVIEQQEKRIKKLESSLKTLTSKINKDELKKKTMSKNIGKIQSTMDEEFEFINKKLYQLDRTVTMALDDEEEDPEYIIEYDENYSTEEDDSDEVEEEEIEEITTSQDKENDNEYNKLRRSKRRGVVTAPLNIEVPDDLLMNSLRRLNPLEYARKLYQTKEIDEKTAKKELEMIETFLNYTKHKKDKSNIDYFIESDIEKKHKINEHLQKTNILNMDITPTFFKVVESDIDEYTKKVILQKIETLSSMDVGSGEYHKLNNWVKSLLDVPWNKNATISVTKDDKPEKLFDYLKGARENMDNVIYGQNSTKDQIIQIIAKMISNPSKSGNVFAIYGAPGTGKTTIIKEGMSKALGIPFNFISLGGATDSSYLDGHSYTYEGSVNGKIVDCLKQSKCMNPIFYFDELDKISSTTKGEEIVNMLIHLTDSSQNTLFQDKYFSGINFDISKSIFVFSFNDIEKVNKILLDRMELIEVDNFKLEEKKVIVKNYIIPRLFENYNITSNQISFTQDIIDYIVDYKGCHKQEKGIRNIIRRFENVISKLNIVLLTGKNNNDIHSSLKNININKLPITIDKSIVDDLVIKRGNGNNPPPFGMYS
jgi:ATP-dependent Lon protease